MKLSRRMAVVLAIAALVATAPAALAGNPFAKATSTAGGYSTWDSDLINVDQVSQTGAGVYVAVLDTGLAPNWTDYFPKARVRADLGIGFEQQVNFKAAADGKDPCGVEVEKGQLRKTTYIGSRGSTHGTHVASTIIGYSYRSNSDLYSGFPLPAIQVRGIAPNATIIPVKVLADYQVPAMPQCPVEELQKQGLVVFGTSEMVAAGIDYVTSLKTGVLKGKPVVINMSLGGAPNEEISAVEKAAIDRAIAAGVIVVAAASNDGELGMSAPGSYPPVISAGSVGWTGEWLDDGASGNPPANGARYRMWWLQNVRGNGTGEAGALTALYPGSGDTVEGAGVLDDVYVSDFSSRERQDVHPQDLDVLAPGSWVRGPYPGDGNYAHLPWWSRGIGDILGLNPGNFYYVGGTSMATPHVASVAALVLQKNPGLVQTDVEAILESSALPLAPTGSQQVWDPFHVDADGNSAPGFYPVPWDTDCDGVACDAVGAGLLQADAAVAATPAVP
jgi:subtilisin family serine protease